MSVKFQLQNVSKLFVMSQMKLVGRECENKQTSSDTVTFNKEEHSSDCTMVPTWDPVQWRAHGITGADSVSVLDDFL